MSRLLCSLYRLLLHAYPADFRRKYGGEMARVFQERTREIDSQQGTGGMLRYLLFIGKDWFQTVLEERIASMNAFTVPVLRVILLLIIAANAATVVGLGPKSSPQLKAVLGMPLALLVMYGLLVMWATVNLDPVQRISLKTATTFGFVSGAIPSAYTTVGVLAHINANIFGPIALLVVLALWGASGYFAARRSGAIGLAVRAGCWSALVAVLIKVTVAFLSVRFSLSSSEVIAAQPEFIHSGWSDPRAWFVYVTVTASGQHLLLGPVVGLLVGFVGGIAGRISGKRQLLVQPQSA